MRSRSSLSLQFRAEAYDFPTGSVTAGTVMSWLDKAGYATAASWTGTNVVAGYVGNLHFAHPVPVETPITVQCRMLYTGTSSVHVQSRLVLPTILDDEGQPTVATEVIMVYVAIDDNGEKVRVKPWEPTTDAAQERAVKAKARSDQLKASEKSLMTIAFPEQEETTAEIIRLRFIVSEPDAGVGVRVGGGSVLRWLDEAANVCGARWVQDNVVAVFAGGVRFENMVYGGDLLEIEARLVHTSAHSMHVMLRAWTSTRFDPTQIPVAHGITVLVDPGQDGKAKRIRPWHPRTVLETELEQHCTELVRMRNEIAYSWAL